MNLLDKKTAQVLFTVLVFALALLFLAVAWRALVAFLFSVFFAYLLEGPVAHVQPWLRGSRNASIAVVYVVFTAVFVLVLALAAPPVVQEAQRLMQQAPELSAKISSGELTSQMGAQHGWSKETIERIQAFLSNHREEVLVALQTIVLRAAQTIQDTWWLILVPILAVFFLKDGRRFGEIIVKSVQGERNRQIVAATIDEMNLMLGRFIRVQLLLAGLAMVVLTFVLWAMRVPYAVALGPAAGALEFIPVVGPVVGGLLILGVAFLANYTHLIWLFVLLLLWRGVQDYVTSPRFMGSKLQLHPLAVLFGVLAGGEVAGVIGVFFSIPVLATIRILWHTWQLYRKSSKPEAMRRPAAET